MKKRILVLIAVGLVALVAGGVTALAQGDSHQPMIGQKLVGIGGIGRYEILPSETWTIDNTVFRITNADCARDVTIEKLCILDSEGNPVYEGPFQKVTPEVILVPDDPDYVTVDIDSVTRETLTTLGPHEGVDVVLSFWVPDGSGGWLSASDAAIAIIRNYTVEIYYSTARGGLGLVGQAEYFEAQFLPSGLTFDSKWSVPMVNLKQVATR